MRLKVNYNEGRRTRDEGRERPSYVHRPPSIVLHLAPLVLCVFLIGADAITLTDVQGAFMQKDYVKTKELAQTFAGQAANPQERIEALYYSGLSDLWLGQYLPARQSIEEIFKSKPSKEMYDKASLALIDTYYMEGNYKKSLSLGEDLLYKRSSSEFLSAIYLKIAKSHFKLAQWKKGRELLQKIIDRFPDSPERFYVDQLLQENQFFAVQVGSYQDRSKAEDTLKGLQQKGEYAYIVETISQDGKKFYRVRAGQFQKFNDAQALETKLSKLGYPTKIYP